MGDVEHEDPTEIHEDAELAPDADVPAEVEESVKNDDADADGDEDKVA